MKVVIGLQARTNSSRLPGKVLLPLGGLPISVLAAKRANNNGLFDVKVLTSTEVSDDHLCHVLSEYDVPYFRGNLDNVLGRFISAFSDYSDETVVVRLTADNVLPDSSFIKEVVDNFLEQDCFYLCANGVSSGLPYGASVEVTLLSCLREAAKLSSDPFDFEHVTSFVRRKYGDNFYNKYQDKNLGYIRCTVDSLDDYIQMAGLFNETNDPIQTSMWGLIEKLQETTQGPFSGVNKLALGCAQLGLDYGINNSDGKPNSKDAYKILSQAARLGVPFFDTARAYGESEAIIGKWFSQGWQGRVSVITKLDPLGTLSVDASEEYVESCVERSVLESCNAIRSDKLDVLMLHRTEHLISYNSVIISKIRALKDQGTIKHIGVSVQTPEELELALKFHDVSFIQLAFNILDNRWFDLIPAIEQARAKRTLTIHVRSVFLQGLLLTRDHDLWARACCQDPVYLWDWLDNMAATSGCVSTYELCIRYILSQPWIDTLVLGTDNMNQLNSNIKAVGLGTLSHKVLEEIYKTRPTSISDKLLNPSQWS